MVRKNNQEDAFLLTNCHNQIFKGLWISIVISLLLATGTILFSCGNPPKNRKFIIGFSQSGEADQWRKSMLEEMKGELSLHPDMKMIYRETHDNSQVQIAQVKDLMEHHIDVLIISASEAAPLTPVVEQVYNSGIPVILIDRKIASEKYTNYIGADNKQVGRLAATYLSRVLKGKGRILEITGNPSSSPANERSLGFENTIKKFPQLKIVKKIDGEWMQSTTEMKLENDPGILDSVDAIFAHNDVMGLGAYNILKKTHKKELPIVGVDALPGPSLGLQAIEDKKLIASMLYPTGGKEAIRNAVLIKNHIALPKQTNLRTMVVDSGNIETMILQTDKIASQQKDIEHQQNILEEQLRIYHNQKSLIYLLFLLLLLFLIASILLFYSRKTNRRINRELVIHNNEILRQGQELVVMSQKADEANEAKLNFFTKISHEFRTPLTLILLPTEELLAKNRLTPEFRTALTYIRKNAFRLLRLVNELMDLRKVKFGKMELQVRENDIVAFCNEIILSFSTIAKKRNIDCRFITQHRSYMLWFDAGIMEKVLFNLLSNAFKFTPDNGTIILELMILSENDQWQLRVEDTGIGMNEEEQSRIFELFFRGKNEKINSSGIGLNLTKDLVEFHHGKIILKSQPNTGTVFTLTFPLKAAAYKKDEIAKSANYQNEFKDLVQLYTTELLPENTLASSATSANIQSEKSTILIIEDNVDLQKLLRSQLGSEYDILSADNGKTGLNKAFDILPDLILCDIMIPVVDGLSVCRQLKKDVRTSHIPVILLTAKATQDQQIEGLKSYANAYLTKPFNLPLLKQTIETLLYNYKKIKERFTAIGYTLMDKNDEYAQAGITSTPLSQNLSHKKSGRKFISEFISIVENNLQDETFSVENIYHEMNISRIQLYRKVKALLNVNVNEYIVNARIQKAKYYLQNEELPVSDIAFKTGFSSAAYFTTVFKSKTGVTPKEFKKSPGG